MVDQLAGEIEDGAQKIGDAVDDAFPPPLAAISTITGTLATMGVSAVAAAVDQLEQLDPAGELNHAFSNADECSSPAPADGSFVWPILVVAAAAGIAIGVMLLVRSAPRAATSATATARRGFSACSRPASRCCSASSSSWPSELRRLAGGCGDRGHIVAQLVQTAQFLPARRPAG